MPISEYETSRWKYHDFYQNDGIVNEIFSYRNILFFTMNGHIEHDVPMDVVFLIEATAMNGIYINELKTNYIQPILEYVIFSSIFLFFNWSSLMPCNQI